VLVGRPASMFGMGTAKAWFRRSRFWVTDAARKPPARDGWISLRRRFCREAANLPGLGLARLKWPEAQQRQPMRMALAGHAESARGISPRAAHRSGLDTLASSGSCHRNEGCRLPPKIGAHPVASWLTPDVGDLPPLLHGHYPASSLLRSSPPLTGASVLSASRFRPLVPFPLASSARFSSSVRKPE
jgi:hypothetical protein